MISRHIYSTVLIVCITFFGFQHSFGQHLEPAQLILRSAFFTKETYQVSQKETAIQDIQNFVRDTLQAGDAKIYLGSDGTFNYRLVVQSHLPNGEVSILNLPFSNVFLGEGYENAKNSFKVSQDQKTWLFKLKLLAGNLGYHHSEILAVPSADNPRDFTYTFTSSDKGKTWLIGLEIE